MNAETKHTPGPWVLYSERRPQQAGVYEWRIPSATLPGMVIVVAAHMRERGAGRGTALSPSFDYWDGYQLRVPAEIEWRETDRNISIREHEEKIVSVEGVDPCDCVYCGAKPEYEAHQRNSDGSFTVCAKPWHLNRWRFKCCAWGSTPTLSDPREIERVRRAAVAKATGSEQA